LMGLIVWCRGTLAKHGVDMEATKKRFYVAATLFWHQAPTHNAAVTWNRFFAAFMSTTRSRRSGGESVVAIWRVEVLGRAA